MTASSKYQWAVVFIALQLAFACQAPTAAAPNTYALHSDRLILGDDDEPEEPQDPEEPSYPDEPQYPEEPSYPDEPQYPEEPNYPEEPPYPQDPNAPETPGEEPDPTDPTNRTTEAAPLNDWGCDTYMGAPTIDSYGEWGACCDRHDECYIENNCTMASWSGAESAACSQCNYAVFACIAQPTGPGPSVCASATEASKQCGQWRSGPK